MQIRPVGAVLFHADRRTDGQTGMTKLIADFRNFSNVPKTDAIKAVKFQKWNFVFLAKKNVTVTILSPIKIRSIQ
jgi:hypothetical protein